MIIIQRNIDSLVQDCSHSIANTLELLQFCTEPSIYFLIACLSTMYIADQNGCPHVRLLSTLLFLVCIISSCYYAHSPGAHFTNYFSVIIQNPLKFHSAIIQVLMKWLLWNFAHDTTAKLLWHVQNFVAMWYPMMELHQNIHPLNLNHDGKIIHDMGPWASD